MAAWELTKTILKDSANLKAYYRFESGALTTDSSGNAHTLTQVNTPTEDASGKYGGAVAYASASSQHHTAVNHVDFRPTGNFSLSGWIKTSTTGATQNIFISAYFPASPYSGIQFIVNSSNKLVLYSYKNTGTVDGTDYKSIASSGTVTDGSWHHVVGTWDGSTLKVYVDGKMDGSVAWANAAGFDATNNKVRVGAGDNAGTANNFFNGSIDDLAFLNGTALSADQIKELYEGRYIGEWWPQANLVGIWHLNGNSTDSSGNNNHGTDTSITYSNANGKFGQGAGFNGTTSRIVVPGSAVPTGAKSFLMWINPSSIASNGYIFTDSDGTNGSVLILLQSDGSLRWSWDGLVTSLTTATGLIEINKWYFVCFTGTGTSGVTYINGVSKASGSIGTESAHQPTFRYAGRYTSSGSGDAVQYTGKMDELTIFSRALSATEIRKYYAWSLGKYL